MRISQEYGFVKNTRFLLGFYRRYWPGVDAGQVRARRAQPARRRRGGCPRRAGDRNKGLWRRTATGEGKP
eukprot:scaffold94683_cov42-Phaeocystis_antarctica.AAC.2